MQEVLPCADGDLFPKAAKSSDGTEGTTPPGNSHPKNTAAALGTQTEMLTGAMANSSRCKVSADGPKRNTGRVNARQAAARRHMGANNEQARANADPRQEKSRHVSSESARLQKASTESAAFDRKGEPTVGRRVHRSAGQHMRRGTAGRDIDVLNRGHRHRRNLAVHGQSSPRALPSVTEIALPNRATTAGKHNWLDEGIRFFAASKAIHVGPVMSTTQLQSPIGTTESDGPSRLDGRDESVDHLRIARFPILLTTAASSHTGKAQLPGETETHSGDRVDVELGIPAGSRAAGDRLRASEAAVRAAEAGAVREAVHNGRPTADQGTQGPPTPTTTTTAPRGHIEVEVRLHGRRNAGPVEGARIVAAQASSMRQVADVNVVRAGEEHRGHKRPRPDDQHLPALPTPTTAAESRIAGTV